MCKVSVVVPVCNVGEYIGTCIESVLNQTIKDVEIICVDDVSKDNSLEVIKSYAAKDSRVKVVAYDVNQSASQARKDGALMAKGEYIMFVDGDDYLETDACEKLYDAIRREKVDMLHFGTNVINAGGANEKRINNLKKLLAPYYGTLHGKDVFEGCFIEKKFRFSIWNKIYEAEYCKRAMSHVKDGNFPKAQDLYAFFVLCYFAESYCGIEESFYNYRFGTGITGNKVLSLAQLERYNSSVLVADAIDEFIMEQNSKYQNVAKEIRSDLLNDCVGNWYTAIVENESAQGFDILCKNWKKEELVAKLCDKYIYSKPELAEKILGAESVQCSLNKETKTIGIVYYRLSIGGVQRVISLLIPMYIEMGYKVVLFTDEYEPENEYSIPENVERVILPSSLKLQKDEYINRAEVLVEKVREHNVDVMCYQAGSSKLLLFDMLLLKLCNVPIVVTVHEVAFQNMLTMNDEMVNRPKVLRLADCVTVLSRVEETYWRALGVNAIYVPNPIVTKDKVCDERKPEKNTIVWIGRLDNMTKGCLGLVPIMKLVTASIPDAKLLVVGNEVSPNIKKRMEKQITKKKLQENVILCGHSTDVDSFYKKAEVHLLTSISETFPMTIAESKSYGLPLVMYELPFVEFCRDKRGYISAPQGNQKKLADAIVKVLTEDECKKRLQQEAKESLDDFLAFDIKGSWKNIFDGVSEQYKLESVEEVEMILRSLLHHYEYGARRNKKEKEELRKKLNEAKKIESSLEYRLGRALLRIPRAVARKVKKI